MAEVCICLYLKKMQSKETMESMSAKIEADVMARLIPYLQKNGFEKLPDELIIVSLKEEKMLEVYAKNETGYVLLKSYPFTVFSGKLGPKLKRGDGQIPEGIYKIEYVNPNSSFYLSMKINFPNEFDVLKSRHGQIEELGSDIFIHGKSSSVGCIAIGDDGIEELFILVSHAINNEIKVVISPRDFRINDQMPQVDVIDWELELYDMIKDAMSKLPANK